MLPIVSCAWSSNASASPLASPTVLPSFLPWSEAVNIEFGIYTPRLLPFRTLVYFRFVQSYPSRWPATFMRVGCYLAVARISCIRKPIITCVRSDLVSDVLLAIQNCLQFCCRDYDSDSSVYKRILQRLHKIPFVFTSSAYVPPSLKRCTSRMGLEWVSNKSQNISISQRVIFSIYTPSRITKFDLDPATTKFCSC